MKKVILGMIAVCALHCGQALSVMSLQQVVEQYGSCDFALGFAIRSNDSNLVHEIIATAHSNKVDLGSYTGSYWIGLAVSLNGMANSHLDIIESLVTHGCNPLRKDANGFSPFDRASPAAKERMRMVLLSANA